MKRLSVALFFVLLAVTSGCEYYNDKPQIIEAKGDAVGSSPMETSDTSEAAGKEDDVAANEEEIIPDEASVPSPSVQPPTAPVEPPALVLDWGTAHTLQDDGDIAAKQPRIAASANGDFFAVWRRGDAGSFGMKKYAAGLGWEKSREVSAGIEDMSNYGLPQVTVADDGDATFVWNRWTIQNEHTAIDGFRWDTGLAPKPIYSSSKVAPHAYIWGDMATPELAHDAVGNVMVAYETETNKVSGIGVRRFSGGKWSEEKRLTPYGGDNFIRPRLSVDGNGVLTVAYLKDQGKTSEGAIYVRRFHPGPSGDWSDGVWEEPVLLSQSANNPTDVQVASDEGGNVMVTWLQYADSDGDFQTTFMDQVSVFARSYDDATKTWTAAKPVEAASTGSAQWLQVVALGDGSFLSAWLVNTKAGELGELRFNVYRDGAWETDRLAETFVGHISSLDATDDGAGHALLVWTQTEASGRRVAANICDATDGCKSENAKIIQNALTGDADNVRAALNNDGKAIAVWEQKNAGQSIIGVLESK